MDGCGDGRVCVSLNKLAEAPHYSTTYGGAHGYNGRALGSKAVHMEKTWHRQYPNPERMRQQSVAARGFDKVSLGRLHNRSSHVQDTIQDQTGLLGHSNVDNYDKIYARGDINTYDTVLDRDDTDVIQYSNIEQYQKKSGHPAFVTADMPANKNRRQLAMPAVRWSSRLHVETGRGGKNGLGEKDMLVNTKTRMYDTEYTHGFCHANHLDSSLAARGGSQLANGYAGFHPRSLLPASQSAAEQLSREPTQRTVDYARLRDRTWVGGRAISFSELERKPTGGPGAGGQGVTFDMRDHIPQYRRARVARPNMDLTNLGVRNTGPIAKSKTEKFWNRPHLPGDTFSEIDARPLEQLSGGTDAGRTRSYSRTLPAQVGQILAN